MTEEQRRYQEWRPKALISIKRMRFWWNEEWLIKTLDLAFSMGEVSGMELIAERIKSKP